MKVTNKYGIPEAIWRAVQNDPYSPGTIEDYRRASGDRDSEVANLISATTLVGPPQIRALYREHFDELEEDVSDRIWTLLGSAVHLVLERAEDRDFDFDKWLSSIENSEDRDVAEVAAATLLRAIGRPIKIMTEKVRPGVVREGRYYALFDNIVISGQADRIQIVDRVLTDYKVTSSWTIIRGPREEWIQQLNIYRWLLKQNGIPIKRIQVGTILRDWSKIRARTSKDYPKVPSVKVPIPLWPLAKTEAFISERLADHFNETIRPCTPEERWATDAEFAVMKRGRKTALRVSGLHTRERAEAWAIKNGHADAGEGGAVMRSQYYIEERPRRFIRCEDRYCPVVDFCPQWKAELESRTS